MRVSEIARWTECEVYALHDPSRPPYRTPIATLVGTLAHSLLAGQDIGDHIDAGTIAWDGKTKNGSQARAQARAIKQTAVTILAEAGWHIIESETMLSDAEVTGHLDLLCWNADMGEAVIDLKTGQVPTTAWLQVGGYLSLSPTSPAHGGVLHVPRQSMGKDTTGTLRLRPAAGLRTMWDAWRKRIQAIQGGAVPTRSPGMHCTRCPLSDCDVRMV